MQPQVSENIFGSKTQKTQASNNSEMHQEQPVQNNQLQQQMEQDDDDDDLDDLDLFHRSSLHNKQKLPLPQIVPETFNVKKFIDENNQSVIKNYVQMQKLGNGAFAQVKKVSENSKFYAMKVYQLMRLKSQKFFAADGNFADSQQMFRNQVQIIKRISHQNLVLCHQIMYSGNFAYLVMQLCELGQIMNWSQQKKDFIRNQKVINYLSSKYQLKTIEDLTRLIFLQLSLGIQYLHSNNISNRDIKIDNILCHCSQSQGNDIKLADFTTVRYSLDDTSYFTCGTVGFRSPQVQNAGSEGYSCKAMDIWGFGVSLYTYYFQSFPFLGESEIQIQFKAENQQLVKINQQKCPNWLREIITKTTCKNYKQRIGIDEVVKILSSSLNL